MKAKFRIVGIFLTLLFASCNQEKKEVVTDEKPEPKVETFDVTVEVIVKKDDDLIVYYRDETNEWFDEDHAIWKNVKGSDQVQTLTFSLPEAVLPNNLRFDFSKNPEQEPVKILKIKISYLGKTFEVNEENMGKYFPKRNRFYQHRNYYHHIYNPHVNPISLFRYICYNH